MGALASRCNRNSTRDVGLLARGQRARGRALRPSLRSLLFRPILRRLAVQHVHELLPGRRGFYTASLDDLLGAQLLAIFILVRAAVRPKSRALERDARKRPFRA